MDPLYLYENAVSLVHGAQMLPANDLNRRKLLSGAIKILWSIQASPDLPTRKADLLLAEVLVRETNSLKLAHKIITESMNDANADDVQILQFRLLEMEAYIKEGNTRAAARSLAQAELLDVSQTLKEIMCLSKLQFGPITSEESKVLQSSSLEIRLVAGVLLEPCQLQEDEAASQELTFMDRLFKVCSKLVKGETQDAEVLAVKLRDMDWADFWANGVLVFEQEGYNLQVSWHEYAQVYAISYLVLTVVHFVMEAQGCTITQQWASELLRGAAEHTPPDEALEAIYFYTALIYHHGGRTSVRDIVLAQLEQLVHRDPSASRLTCLRYCQAVIAQSEGRKTDALKLYAYVYEHGNPEFQACALLNQLTMVKSLSLLAKLQALSPGPSIQSSLEILKVFTEETSSDSLKALQGPSWSPLQRALMELCSVSLPGVASDARARRLESLVGIFHSMGLTHWENHSQRLLDAGERS